MAGSGLVVARKLRGNTHPAWRYRPRFADGGHHATHSARQLIIPQHHRSDPMFTKKVYVGSASRTTTAKVYRTVIDWEAVGGAIFIFVIGLLVLSSCGG